MALTFTPTDELLTPLPDFNLNSVFGEKFSAAGFRYDSAALIMFICNHCPYVKAVEDRLITLGHDLKKLNIPVIAICSNDPEEYPEDNLQALRARAEEKKYPFTYLHDPDQKVAHLFGAVCTPDFFVYNSDRKLAYRGRLDDSWKDETKVQKRELFEAILKVKDSREAITSAMPSMGCNIKWSLK